MKQVFLKKGEVSLINGGYISNPEGTPVSNYAFYAAQKHAHYLITLAGLAKDKDFTGKAADSFSDLVKEASRLVSEDTVIEFVSAPSEVKVPTMDKLKAEALKMMEFEESKDVNKKVNEYLQQFKVIHEFETFGLFFVEDIQKLSKIYTMDDIVAAVTALIDKL